MVHRKSEYRFQYHNLSSNTRLEIWRDNMKYRELYRRHNLADHYWSHQLVHEPCICDSEDDDYDLFPNSRQLPRESTADRSNIQSHIVSRQVAVQTPDWKELYDETNFTEAISAQPKDPTPRNVEDTLEAEDGLCLSSTEKPLKVDCVPTTRHTQIGLPAEFDKNSGKTKKSSFNFSPTKTKCRSYIEEKKTPFAAYGWNDSDKIIGEKKTHNVCAPSKEVYTTALKALEIRQKELQQYLDKERERQRRELLFGGPVNLSSIWMSEYQQQFSKGEKALLASPS